MEEGYRKSRAGGAVREDFTPKVTSGLTLGRGLWLRSKTHILKVFELWCWRRLLDSKEIKSVSPKGNQSWIFTGRTDAEAPILWPPDAKSRLTGKDPESEKDWRQEEKGTKEDEIVGWHHRLNGHAAAAAKSLQSCPTLCDPIDGSPPGSTGPGILQARTLEWVAISFSNAWKWKGKVKSLSCVRLLATPWTAAYQAPPSMGFSRQEYWSGVPLPSPSGQEFEKSPRDVFHTREDCCAAVQAVAKSQTRLSNWTTRLNSCDACKTGFNCSTY